MRSRLARAGHTPIWDSCSVRCMGIWGSSGTYQARRHIVAVTQRLERERREANEMSEELAAADR